MNTLLTNSRKQLLTQIETKSSEQLILLEKLKAPASKRHVRILKGLYDDTPKIFGNLRHLIRIPLDSIVTNAKQGNNPYPNQASKSHHDMLCNLEIRHAGVLETLAEYTGNCSLLQRNKDILTVAEMVEQHTQISIFLSHLVSLSLGKEKGSVEDVDLHTLIKSCKYETQLLVEHHYNIAPDVEILVDCEDKNVSSIESIPSILRFIIIELLKNSSISTIEQYCIDNNISEDDLVYNPNKLDEIKFPFIQVELKALPEIITIRITDKGIGLAKNFETLPRDFAQSTLFPFKEDRKEGPQYFLDQQSYQPPTVPCKGFGIGVYLSFLYAKHLGAEELTWASGGVSKGCEVTLTFIKKNQ